MFISDDADLQQDDRTSATRDHLHRAEAHHGQGYGAHLFQGRCPVHWMMLQGERHA